MYKRTHIKVWGCQMEKQKRKQFYLCEVLWMILDTLTWLNHIVLHTRLLDCGGEINILCSQDQQISQALNGSLGMVQISVLIRDV